jgi:outer membrane protein
MLNNPLHSLLICGLVSLLSVSAYAASAENTINVFPEPQLQKLFDLALTNNPTLQVSEAKQLAAQSKIDLAESQQQPTVSLQSELSYAWMKNNDFGRSANQLRASYPLYQPNLTDQLSLAKYQESSSEWQLKSQRQMLLRKVAEAYYQYRSQQAQVDYLAKEQQSIESILSQVEQRFQVGYQDLNDIAEIQARLDKNRAEQLLAQQQLEVIAANLEVYLGQPADMATWTLPADLPKMDMEQYQAALNRVRQHPELNTIQQAEKAAQEQAVLVKSQDGIQLEAFGAYVYNESDGNFYDDMRGFKGGLQLSLPLYLGGRTDSKVAMARAESKQLNAQHRDLERVLTAQAKSSWLTYQAGIKRLESLKAVLSSSEQALQATENGLSTGNRNILDLLNAQRRLHRAERDLPMLKAQIWQAWYQLQWALGKLEA